MSFSTHTINAADGTTLGYRKTGSGPGLVVCHGAGRISQNYEKLARALAGSYTVYTPDRRGRGLSGAEGSHYNLQVAAADLIEIIRATGAAFVFGHSAGGLIALHAMLTHPMKKLAVYEPPISVNNSFPLSWLAAFERALEAGRRKKAMAISLKGLEVAGISKLPLPAIVLLVNALAILEGKKESGTRMLDLLPTLTADVKMVAAASPVAAWRNLAMPAGLLYGSESPGYFRAGIEALSVILPQSSVHCFNGFDHYSPEEKTTEIAAWLDDFFSGG